MIARLTDHAKGQFPRLAKYSFYIRPHQKTKFFVRVKRCGNRAWETWWAGFFDVSPY